MGVVLVKWACSKLLHACINDFQNAMPLNAMYRAGNCGTCKYYCDYSAGNVTAADLKVSYMQQCNFFEKLERRATLPRYTHNLAADADVPSGQACTSLLPTLHQHASVLCNNNGTHVQCHDIGPVCMCGNGFVR